jgi:hypothetical protein
MEIAIIGSGNVGKALAGATVRNGHSVTLTAADPDHARTAAESVGARAADSNLEAVDRAELVVLAVYSPVVVHVLDEIIDALAGKILVDPTNPMAADAYGPALEGDSGAEFIQQYVLEARVVKPSTRSSPACWQTRSSTVSSSTASSRATTMGPRARFSSSCSRLACAPSTPDRSPWHVRSKPCPF